MKGKKALRGLIALVVIASVVRKVGRHARHVGRARSRFGPWRHRARGPQTA
jgi:hypothetical protein